MELAADRKCRWAGVAFIVVDTVHELYPYAADINVTNGTFSPAFFFFSSRRRHTRLQGDWSSDVCSSDLFPHRDEVERVRQHVERSTGDDHGQHGARNREGDLGQTRGGDERRRGRGAGDEDRKSVV